MQRRKIFISSVQSEFATERQILFEYLTSDALLGKFFEPFIFENVPALSVHPTTVFLKEIENSDVYLGVFGQQYGYEDSEGISPTEREFDAATNGNKTRFVYIKQAEERHPKEELLIRKAENVVVRRSFKTPEQLKIAVYVSLVNYLIENEIIRTTPFDATLDTEATFEDLSEEKIRKFVGVAHRKRAFPFTEDSDIKDVLTHLNLIKGERITNAALLLFGLKPQRFFITSEVRCAHFHGLNKVYGFQTIIRRATVPLVEQIPDSSLTRNRQVTGQVTGQVTEKIIRLINVINNQSLSVKEMLQYLSLSGRDNFLKEYLFPAIEKGFVVMLFPKSPNHPKQRYFLTENGIEMKNKLKQ